MEIWVRRSLWLSIPFNFIAAFAIAFPTSAIGRALELPEQGANFYTLFSGGLVGLFGLMYLWNALQPSIDRPTLAVGAVGKSFAVLLSAILFHCGMFSGLALLVISGDLVFAGLWLYWLLGNSRRGAA